MLIPAHALHASPSFFSSPAIKEDHFQATGASALPSDYIEFVEILDDQIYCSFRAPKYVFSPGHSVTCSGWSCCKGVWSSMAMWHLRSL